MHDVRERLLYGSCGVHLEVVYLDGNLVGADLFRRRTLRAIWHQNWRVEDAEALCFYRAVRSESDWYSVFPRLRKYLYASFYLPDA